MFRALRHRDFRLFWIGQGISVSGTWMQTMAQSWLVYRLTDSPFYLGALAISRFGPSLVGSPIAGVLTDRVSRRNLVMLTQTLSLIQASLLAVLTLSGWVRVWHVLLLAFLQGIIDTMDMPARQTLQVDLVGVEDIQSAVALNSAVFNVGRLIGPAFAGVLVSVFGEGICFAVNAGSYLAVLLALVRIPVAESVLRAGGTVWMELQEGIRFVWFTPDVRRVILAIGVMSLVGLSANTLLPVLARDILHAGATGYGTLLAGTGVGAIIGALVAAQLPPAHNMTLINAFGLGSLGVGLMALGLSRNLLLATLWMVLVGMAAAIQLPATNAYLQTSAPPRLRGRIVSIYFWLFTGLSPLGGLLVGLVAERHGAAGTVVSCGAICSLCGLFWATHGRYGRGPAAAAGGAGDGAGGA